MTDRNAAGVFPLGDQTVGRLGYGAMQLAGPGVFGPPKDHGAALAVLREAVANGVDHIDTSDFYGPHVTNRLIREALHPYPKNLVIVTKVGAVRGDDASWIPALMAADLTRGVHDNLRNLAVDVLDVVNLRVGGVHSPSAGSIEEQFTTLAELQRQGLIRHLGLSNVTSAQVEEGRRIAKVVCVQNHYNLAHREDDALIDELTAEATNAGGVSLAAAPLTQLTLDPWHLVDQAPAREPRCSRTRHLRRYHYRTRRSWQW